jgi:hypothetical protein
MMKSDGKETREGLVEFLKSHGWDDEKANKFLDDKVGVRQLQIPGQHLLDVLQAVCKEGIPFGTITVSFLVPDGNWDVFKASVEASIGKHGGFVFTPEEQASLAGLGAETKH